MIERQFVLPWSSPRQHCKFCLVTEFGRSHSFVGQEKERFVFCSGLVKVAGFPRHPGSKSPNAFTRCYPEAWRQTCTGRLCESRDPCTANFMVCGLAYADLHPMFREDLMCLSAGHSNVHQESLSLELPAGRASPALLCCWRRTSIPLCSGVQILPPLVRP